MISTKIFAPAAQNYQILRWILVFRYYIWAKRAVGAKKSGVFEHKIVICKGEKCVFRAAGAENFGVLEHKIIISKGKMCIFWRAAGARNFWVFLRQKDGF